MLDIRQLRQKYESIKQSTPKKCLTPTISAQHVKNESILMTPQSAKNKIKKVCNNCINKQLMVQKESRLVQEKLEDQKIIEQVKQQLNQENQYRDQLADEQKRKQLTALKINAELIHQHHERSKTEHENDQKEVANYLKHLEKEEHLRHIKSQEKKEYIQQYYLRDLKNQIISKEEQKKQQKLQNNKSDQIESQYWSQMEHDQIQNQQSKAQLQRQLINYWKSTVDEKEKLRQQQQEMKKIEQEQMKYLQKSNDKLEKANQIAKKQQIELFKKEIEQQKQIKEKQKQLESEIKKKDFFTLMQQKNSEEQLEKLRFMDKQLERSQFVKDIETQLKEKKHKQPESTSKLLIKEQSVKLESCDECKHQCPQKVITFIQ